MGRSSDKYAAPLFSAFPLNSTHENATQRNKQEGHKRCPVVGAIMLALERPPTPKNCQRPRLEDHDHESISERRDRGRRQMMEKKQTVRSGKRNWEEEISGGMTCEDPPRSLLQLVKPHPTAPHRNPHLPSRRPLPAAFGRQIIITIRPMPNSSYSPLPAHSPPPLVQFPCEGMSCLTCNQ